MTPEKRAALNKKKKQRRRSKLIRVWINRAIALAVLALIIGLVVWGVKSLFFDKSQTSAYGLPDYVTEDYLKVNTYSRPKVPLLEVNNIVIHYTANPGTSATANRNYFNNLADQSGVENPTYASSNFIVGLEGEVIACVPIDEVAYASNNRNEDTISIETCHPDETGKFSDVTYASLVKLSAWLCNKYGLTGDDLIRHYDVTGKLCPLYYVENEEAWTQLKADVQTALEELQQSESTENGGE
ncbi:MAG: N-acetylmuramoyl-L-alanine amidase [Firmicutes bacterium]|nr:N-acetylmuramoyl-L-alanine amidase [Bacillota bacterium]